jgi:hypothetical protein
MSRDIRDQCPITCRIAGRMQLAFGRAEVLNAGNRAVHFHRYVPIVRDRIGLPPDVPAVALEALIPACVGYVFLEI